jgi:hypothetical protein
LGKKATFSVSLQQGPYLTAPRRGTRVTKDEHAIRRDLVDRHSHMRSAAQLSIEDF